ncbi:hypothetical protein ACJIZ3_020981 [Penstemon smallii]|uniref:TITAN-like protein n=1 Tax=Penstemon smallii TaxID=265156 RepID=A0ABD3SKC9_9LAMI
MNHKKKKKNTGEQEEFEFCEVCRLNHNQGRRHIYFPKHKTSLSTLLTRFQSKLSDVKLFLKTPIPLRPEHADKKCIWCIFCNCDIIELGSPFSCGNAIQHLASGEHWKRVKGFMWKHGGGMDRVDIFRIAEVDFAKWEKKCKSLKTEAAKAESVGPLNNIHNEIKTDHFNSFHKNNVNFLDFNTTNNVLPLQSYTNERDQVSCSVLSSVPEASSSWHNMSGDTQVGEAQCTKISTGCRDNYSFNSFARECWSHGHTSTGPVNSEVRIANGESTSQGLLNLAKISSTPQKTIEGNVHTGAPPPWLNSAEGNQLDVTQKPELSNLFPSKAVKSSKLNPKRVGAAWAERRKLELELERRGELVTNNFDANWLPNFGRVWQSGTRKESRKEFQTEKKSSHKVDNQSEKVEPLQPYISKRMRGDKSQ